MKIEKLLFKFGKDVEFKESLDISGSEKDQGLIDLVETYSKKMKKIKNFEFKNPVLAIMLISVCVGIILGILL